jgi:hypothetical protein
MILVINKGEFRKVNWSKNYPHAKEAIPTDMPEPEGVP